GVELRLLEPAQVPRDAAARDGVRLRAPLGVLLVDDLERLDDLIDLLDRVVGAPRGLLLAIVLVQVAEPALLLEPEVLALPVDGEVDEVAPLDGRRHLRDGLAALERSLVV